MLAARVAILGEVARGERFFGNAGQRENQIKRRARDDRERFDFLSGHSAANHRARRINCRSISGCDTTTVSAVTPWGNESEIELNVLARR